jgi:release factor glutamine methyltransferase
MGQAWTTMGLLQTTTTFLAERGHDEARLVAERLLAHVLQFKRVDLYLQTERPVQETELSPYRDLVRSVARGAPLQYVIGETEFMGLPFQVDKRALIPRPETEILVDVVRKYLAASAGSPAAVLELGVGSGAIAVSLAVLQDGIQIWGTEIIRDAAQLAQRNARIHGVHERVHLVVGSRFDALSPELEGAFAVVVSNPPYVRSDEMPGLDARVRQYEPIQALDGGNDGLDFHRYLTASGLRFLSPGGLLATEIGAAQGTAAQQLFADAGMQDVAVLRDYAGLDRVVVGRKR